MADIRNPAGKSSAVDSRQCGTCSLCCKLIAVDELQKLESTWCRHCDPGKVGCRIYEQRPQSCRDFHCGWLQSTEFGPEWYPQKGKMVLAAEGDGNRLTVYVDPAFPLNWRKEPYYSQLKDLAHRLAGRVQLMVRINDRAIALLPNKEIELGRFERDDHIVFLQDRTTGNWDAQVIKAKDVPSNRRDQWYSTF